MHLFSVNRCSCNKRRLQFSASQILLVHSCSEHWVPTVVLSGISTGSPIVVLSGTSTGSPIVVLSGTSTGSPIVVCGRVYFHVYKAIVFKGRNL